MTAVTDNARPSAARYILGGTAVGAAFAYGALAINPAVSAVALLALTSTGTVVGKVFHTWARVENGVAETLTSMTSFAVPAICGAVSAAIGNYFLKNLPDRCITSILDPTCLPIYGTSVLAATVGATLITIGGVLFIESAFQQRQIRKLQLAAAKLPPTGPNPMVVAGVSTLGGMASLVAAVAIFPVMPPLAVLPILFGGSLATGAVFKKLNE